MTGCSFEGIKVSGVGGNAITDDRVRARFDEKSSSGRPEISPGYRCRTINNRFFVSDIIFLFRSSIFSAALAGALIGFAASCSFALISLRSGTDRSAGRILLDLYLGQLAKWIVIVITMVATFKYLPGVDQNLNILMLLAIFLLTQSAYIIAPSAVKKYCKAW